jgi:hypothetical protein
MFDIFFFSCGESFADKHLRLLLEVAPEAKHVQGIKGTAKAWSYAASQCSSSHFFSVDADNLVHTDFSWTVPDFIDGDPRVHVWRCRNSINHLAYGHNAMKLWSVEKVREEARHYVEYSGDFTAHISKHGFKIQAEIASTAVFNFSAYETWHAAFKECRKMAAGKTRYAGSTSDPNLIPRLRAWASIGRDAEYGEYCILGARQGILEGLTCNGQLPPYSTEHLRGVFDSITNVEEELRLARERLLKLGLCVEEYSAVESARFKDSQKICASAAFSQR